jgi:hypothetical protein
MEIAVPPHLMWPLLDFAIQLAKEMRPNDFLEPSVGQAGRPSIFGQDLREFIAFDGVEAFGPQIRPSILDELKEGIGDIDFKKGARIFLSNYVRTIAQRVPEALDWWSLKPLLPYLQRDDQFCSP